MRVLDMRGGYLYQHRPDVVPHGYLSDDEVALWAAYYTRRQAESDSAAAHPTQQGQRRG